MRLKFFAILLIVGLVLGTYSISNYAMALSEETGKEVTRELTLPPASPPGLEKSGNIRIIASTTSEQGISDIQQKGCAVVHRLNDATSFSCPSGVVETLDNARPVKVYYPHGLDSAIQINADKVWVLGFTGIGPKVVVLDTGVQKSHAELNDDISLTADFTGLSGDDEDSDGHGTHVSGIITSAGTVPFSSGSTKGVAPDANVLVGKVCGVEFCLEDDVIDGIEWAEEQGADVINLSLGGGLTDEVHCDNDGDKTVDAVNNATAKGIVVVISSGNDSSEGGVSYPACASGAIAVGASNGNNIASYSNTGPAMDIVAPGTSILSTYSCNAINHPRYKNPCGSTWAATLSGTSMASPHVAGVVALMLEKNPNFSVAQIKDALYNSATQVGDGNFDGNGRVDALAAVNAVPSPTLLAHYEFENNLSDSTGNSNDGTINIGGSETYVTGLDGKALDFDGFTHIELANESNFDFNGTDAFSVSTWFNTDVTETGAVSDFIFGKMDGPK